MLVAPAILDVAGATACVGAPAGVMPYETMLAEAGGGSNNLKGGPAELRVNASGGECGWQLGVSFQRTFWGVTPIIADGRVVIATDVAEAWSVWSALALSPTLELRAFANGSEFQLSGPLLAQPEAQLCTVEVWRTAHVMHGPAAKLCELRIILGSFENLAESAAAECTRAMVTVTIAYAASTLAWRLDDEAELHTRPLALCAGVAVTFKLPAHVRLFSTTPIGTTPVRHLLTAAGQAVIVEAVEQPEAMSERSSWPWSWLGAAQPLRQRFHIAVPPSASYAAGVSASIAAELPSGIAHVPSSDAPLTSTPTPAPASTPTPTPMPTVDASELQDSDLEAYRAAASELADTRLDVVARAAALERTGLLLVCPLALPCAVRPDRRLFPSGAASPA